jgi:phosphoglycerate dehydrogenase-like enzyme
MAGFRVRAVHLLFPPADYESVRCRLERALGPDADITITMGNADPAPESCLLLAPHEFDTAAQTSMLGRHDWRWVHLSTAGYDFFPLGHAPADAWVTRSWRTYAAPLAEYALRALLRHAWDVAGTGIRGRLVGVVGYGAVGQRIVDLMQLLDARVIVLRRSGVEVPNAAVTRDLRDLLAVQHLVLALPLNPASAGLIGREFLGACLPGMHLVNIARGEFVDQDALLDAVRQRDVWATLDVTVPEPLPPAHPLRLERRVHISDHIAWRSGVDNYHFIDDFLEVWAALRRNGEPPGLLRRPSTLPD